MSTRPAVKEIWNLIETQKSIKETNQQLKKLSAETNEGLRQARSLFETQWGRLMESLVIF